MALISDKCLFLHIPKTGGGYIRKLYKDNDISFTEIGHKHTHFPDLYEYNSPEHYKNKFIFTFIRHPLSWYQSRWLFRIKTGWEPDHPLDYNCASNDFNDFVNRCLKYEPDGWVTKEYYRYLHIEHNELSYIGKLENITTDVMNIKNITGEKFEIKDFSKVNNSDLDGFKSQELAIYNDVTKQAVIEVESKIIIKYYDGWVPSL